MGFVKVEKGRYLTSTNMFNFSQNFNDFAKRYTNAGITVGGLIDCLAPLTISPDLIINKMNAVEKNIQTIHKAYQDYSGGKTEPFYKVHNWTEDGENRRKEVYRWIDWMNSMNELTP